MKHSLLTFWANAVLCSIALLFSGNVFAQTISTYAAGIGDGLPAATYGRLAPASVAVDGAGNVYVMDNGLSGNNPSNLYGQRIRKISPAGIITTIAGNGASLNISAAPAGTAIYVPIPGAGTGSGITSDAAGNIYISNDQTIDKINTSGILSVIAGNPDNPQFSGDGGPATAAAFNHPVGLAVDATGNIYIADENNDRIRKISTAGLINTIAGGGSTFGDGGLAITATLSNPTGVAVDAAGNVYIADNGNNRIRKVNTSGIISTIAGTGAAGYSGEGGPATAATISAPYDIKVDGAGNIYISMTGRICEINAAGTIKTIAVYGNPKGISFDGTGNVYFAGSANVLKVDTSGSGIINTVAGNGLPATGFGGDGGTALLAEFGGAGWQPIGVSGLWLDPANNLYVADEGNNRIRKINTSGIITTIAGNGGTGFTGDGGPATAAELNEPVGGVSDGAGNLYIADLGSNRIRKIDLSGNITTVAGGGTGGLGDGGPATAAVITAHQVGTDSAGNIYIADKGNYRIRKVNISTGIITTVAGTGISGHTGDGGAATAAELSDPVDVKVDKNGNIYIADEDYLRKVNTSGIITTIAGVEATSLTIDKVGNVYVAYDGNSINIGIGGYSYYNTVIQVAVNGSISIIAGNGIHGYMGEDIAATVAELLGVTGLAIDTSGNLFIGDGGSNNAIGTNGGSTIRKVGIGIVVPPLIFTNGTAQVMTVCPSSGATAINTLLSVSDPGIGNTDVWSVNTAPTHGTLGGFTASATSTGGTITPTGLTYTPTTGYTGTDSFKIKISNGTDTALTKVTVTINASSTVDTIAGLSAVCVGSTISLTDGTTAGTWSSSNTAVATVGPAGAVTGISAGTDTIKYTVASGSCGTVVITHPVTVNALPGAITGSSTICNGTSITFTDTTAGGAWSSSNTAHATVNATSGLVTGVALGAATITYTSLTGCKATLPITVTTSASAGTISGPSSVCTGATINLTDGITGGVWSSSNSHATISGGVVTPVSAGIDTISYTVTSSCGTAVATKVITINASTGVSVITGPSSVCTNSSITLSDSASGGTWSSANPNISVGGTSGEVVGLAPGTATITYTVYNTCGEFSATANVTVYPAPSAGVITGSTIMCTGSLDTLSDAVSGGVWSSGTPEVASVSSTGVVTSLAAGTGVIFYTVTNGCGSDMATAIVNVNSSTPISYITGATVVCSGSTITLSDAAVGGTWGSSDATIAAVNGSGVVTGVAPGVVTISYSASLGCGISVANAEITVNGTASAGAITGTPTICMGATALLSATAEGGVWSSSNGNATVSPTGIITGVAAGADTITYTVTNSCGSAATSYILNVYPSPDVEAITGASTLCSGSTITLSDAVSGGTWSSGNTSIATVSATGVVTGVSGGTDVISYTIASGCGTAAATQDVTVSTTSAGTITGVTTLCEGNTTTLTDGISGGTWSSNAPTVATVNSSGVVTGLAPGYTVISYTVTDSCGTPSVSSTVSVTPLPFISAIYGIPFAGIGQTSTLYNLVAGGAWSSSDTAIATINTGGVVTGVALGTATITYTMINSFGCSTDTTFLITVVPTTGIANINGGNGYKLYPNPATNEITIAWYNQTAQNADVVITDMIGREVLRSNINMAQATGSTLLDVAGIDDGTYLISIHSTGSNYSGKLVILK